MTILRRNFMAVFVMAAVALTMGAMPTAKAASADEINSKARASLQHLYRTNSAALAISKQARAVLVFPNIVKAGLVFGGAYGEGALFRGRHVIEHYNSISASWGLQAGAETYGYALFLMNDRAINYLHRSQGWEIGVGPTVTVVNEGVARNLSSTTLKDDVYAFIFDQHGLMASLSIEGSKITPIKR